MKTKLMIIFSLLLILFSGQTVPAEEHNFAAGSLIIPMDNYYQSEVDGRCWKPMGWFTTC